MNIDLFARARIGGGDDERLSVEHESDMADKAFVQDGVHLRFVVDAAHGPAPHLRSFGGRVRGRGGFHCVSTLARSLDRKKIHFC